MSQYTSSTNQTDGENKHRRVTGTRQVLQVDPDQGEIRAFGERFLLISVRVVHAMEDRIGELFGRPESDKILYEISKNAGRDYVRLAWRSGNQLKTLEDLEEAVEQLGTLGGWGRIQAIEYDLDRKIMRVRWNNSVSVRRRDGTKAVCHFGRGVLAGAAEELFHRNIESVETNCEAKGDEYCEAVFSPSLSAVEQKQ